MKDRPVVLFLCIHNSGRSAAARVLLAHYAEGRVEVLSAGSEPGDQINPAVAQILTERGLDPSKEFPKPLTDEFARAADVIVTMGCGDACPVYPGKRYLDWELIDPAGLPVEQVRPLVDDIDRRVRALLGQLVPATTSRTPDGAASPKRSPAVTESTDIRETVRRRYAAAATNSSALHYDQARAAEVSYCGEAPVSTTDASGRVVFGAELYTADTAEGAPDVAVAASLGCGVPTAVADLRPGETVLDLGSGAGADVLISARRVMPGGRAIGLDMTTEMLELARRNATDAGVTNVEFIQGYLEDIPLPDASVDVVISNCVINLAADKRAVLGEAARVLRPGGRFAVSDVVADADMDEATRADMAQWTGCVAGALIETEYRSALRDAGLLDVEIIETHRVHSHAVAAIIRARKP